MEFLSAEFDHQYGFTVWKNSVDPDQKPADLDLNCLHKISRILKKKQQQQKKTHKHSIFNIFAFKYRIIM